MSNWLNFFWKKYEKHYRLFAGATAGLFLLQLLHLYWLTTHVVIFRLFNNSLFDPSPFWQFLIIVVDYTEIPAIVSTSLLYVYALKQKWNKRDLILLILLNSQWLHLFWISDEFVVKSLRHQIGSTILPFWLAWAAIIVDYLELPVMYDTLKKFFSALKAKN